MAGFIQDLLGDSPGNVARDAVRGFFGNDYLRDYTHASKTFRTDGYAYSPKYKFLFHVYFDINYDLIGNGSQAFPADNALGLAVKSITLPSYSMDTHTMNQYNRKRIVQTKIKYDDISISFHDDNANLVRQMWYNYYSYHYKDPTKSTIDDGSKNRGSIYDYNKRNLYDATVKGDTDWGFVGESSKQQLNDLQSSLGLQYSKAPFFKSIKIYGFNQHNFVMYQLINPMITTFKHDTYDYSATSATMESTMGIAYETVKYYQGAIDGKAITNNTTDNGPASDFAKTHYDKTVSPIARPGANGTIFGQGGLVDGLGGVISDLGSGNILGAIQTAGRTAQTFGNRDSLTQALKGDVVGGIRDTVSGTPNRNNLFSFRL